MMGNFKKSKSAPKLQTIITVIVGIQLPSNDVQK